MTTKHIAFTASNGPSHEGYCSCGWRSVHPTTTGALRAIADHEATVAAAK